MNISRLTTASTLATKLTVIYVVAITIVAELSPALKAFLKSLTGHHWTTKSISSIALYFLVLFVAYLFSKTPTDDKLNRSILGLFWFVLVGSLVLFLFFVWHYLFA